MARYVGEKVYRKSRKEPYKMSNVVWWTLFLLVVMVTIGLLTHAARGQDYGSADFSKRDAAVESDAVACWDFTTAYSRGDRLADVGNFETGRAAGGCTYCPTGLTCICNPTSDLTQETTKLYKGNNAVKQTSDAVPNAALLFLTHSFSAKTAYQITFRYKGDVGGSEDFDLQLTDASSNYYNFDTDTWAAPAHVRHYTNISSSWTTENLYVLVDATARPSSLLTVANASASQTIYYDDLQIRELRMASPTSNTQLSTSVAVAGDPIFDNSGDKYSFKRQPGPWGIYCDGVNDWVSYPDTGNTFDPCATGKNCYFSAACTFIPSKSQTGIVFGKRGAATVSWDLLQGATDMLLHTNDGVATTTLTKAGVIAASVLHSVVATFRYITSGTSNTANIYVNNTAVASDAAMRYPADIADPTYICGEANTPWQGTVEKCCFWQRELSSLDANKWINPYFLPSPYDNGFYVDTCTQAAAHATCSWDKCRDGTPNACQAEDTGVMSIFDTKTEICPNNSWETISAGDDSSPTWTGWTKTEVAGDGTSRVTAYRSSTIHGSVSARIKLTGTTSQADLASICIPVTPGATYYTYAKVKKLSGTARFWPILIQYSDGACATPVGSTTLYDGDISTVWGNELRVSTTVTGGTNSVVLDLLSYRSASDILIDTVSFKTGSYPTPWVHNSGAATTVYNLRDYRLHNPLADANSQTGALSYLSGFNAGVWVYSDWAGDDNVQHRIVKSTASGGQDWSIHKGSTNDLTFAINNGAVWKSVYTTVTSTTWKAGTWKYVEAATDNTGNIKAHWYETNDSTWRTISTASGAGTGIMSAQGSTIEVGSAAGTELLNGYLQYLFISPYNVAYTNRFFNSGKPPKSPK